MKKSFLSACAAIGVFLAAAAAVFALFSTYTRSQNGPCYLTPIVTDARGWDLYTIENGTRRALEPEELLQIKPGNTFYLSRTLTQDLEHDGHTFLLLGTNCPWAVFLDDHLLYTTCPEADLSMDHVIFPDSYRGLSARSESVRCTLPANFAGRTLTLACAHETDAEYISMPRILLSSEALESELSMKNANSHMIPAAGFAITALILFGIWLFALFHGIRTPHTLLLIFAALLQTFSHLRQYEFSSPASTFLDTTLSLYIPAVSMLLPLTYLFLEIKTARNRIIFGIIVALSAIISLIAPTAGQFGGLPFYSPFLESNKVFYVTLTALLIFSIIEAIQKNTASRIFLSGLSVIIFSVILLYAGSLLGSGYHASTIRITLQDPYTFFEWCAVVLFLLSALVNLYQVISHMLQIHSDLAVHVELANQLDRQLSVQKDFYEARLEHEKETRALRHDMNGHLKTLSFLLDDHKMAEAKNYLHELLKQHDTPPTEVFCSNPYVNAVLGNYAAQCRENQIDFVCRIDIGNHEVPAPELCLILNNALQNAFEASLNIPESGREVKLNATVHHHVLMLRISNRFSGSICTKNGLPVTTKSGAEHGYGLSNIRQAAIRTGGSMEYRAEDGVFILDIDMPVKE